MRPTRVVFFAIVAVLVGTNCAQVPGGTCTTGSTECYSASSMLDCTGGTWSEIPCRGPKGCDGSCDIRLGVAGEACPTLPPSTVVLTCSVDGKMQVSCDGGTWHKVSDCSSPCTSTNGQINCPR